MSYYKAGIVSEIEEAARIFYIDRSLCSTWNTARRGDELRLLTGFSWVARDGSGKQRHGFKTFSAAARDAYYVLIQHREQPVDVGRTKVIRLDAARRKKQKQQHEPVKLGAVG